MNRYAKASAPINWPGPRAGQPDGGGMSLPSPRLTPTLGANYNVRGPAAQLALPCVPPTGCRGKALMSIPEAMGRPAITGIPNVVSPITSASLSGHVSTDSILPYSFTHSDHRRALQHRICTALDMQLLRRPA